VTTDGDPASATARATAGSVPVAGFSSPLEMTVCPLCGLPAEIADRAVAASTAGPVEIVRIMCVHRHWFMMNDSRLR
jgi:hypothetical protein